MSDNVERSLLSRVPGRPRRQRSRRRRGDRAEPKVGAQVAAVAAARGPRGGGRGQVQRHHPRPEVLRHGRRRGAPRGVKAASNPVWRSHHPESSDNESRASIRNYFCQSVTLQLLHLFNFSLLLNSFFSLSFLSADGPVLPEEMRSGSPANYAVDSGCPEGVTSPVWLS